MKRIAIAACLIAVSCNQPRSDHSNDDAGPKAPRAIGELLQENDLRYDELGKEFRWTRTSAFSGSRAMRDAQGWPVPDPTKITVRYSNPDTWGADPAASTGKGKRDCLVAICPASKEIVESDLEPRGTHAVLELPSPDCQIRLTNRDFHGYPVAHLHRQPGVPGARDYHAPRLPPGTQVGAVIDLGEITPPRE
ncbi:hypothetical protein [Polyangium aurulentum]|uniref:hypothetical protein n=1 Tax=Polyangium aurulentum TaxID=2567896 RepID=UPI0010AEC448|nr:hypothetical protein [Polyangium aurulentum]UQA58506.1 hypothetical protein E8A73_045925 [Polyangium aurulentum]